jgi:membrane-bound lytic murein transglycosylase D
VTFNPLLYDREKSLPMMSLQALRFVPGLAAGRRCVLIVLGAFAGTAGAGPDLPRPASLQPAVDFWTRIYARVSSSEGLLHDRDNLAIVYDKLELENGYRHPARERRIRQRRAHYRRILQRLASGKRANLGPAQRHVLELWPDGVSDARLRRAARNIRFQLGQADKFRQGLIRAGAWEPHMRSMLAEMELPAELAALPHVESSFNPDAYSRLGAAGIWQFTRLTGRRFLRVDHIVDERMDPFAATEAAGRLLKQNYSVTGDWGLAVTAYNHGLAGIRRAVRITGSNDIADIIDGYDGRRWGFASRNFYPAFLAAVEVDEHARAYFGELERREPLVTETVRLPFYTRVEAVLEAHPVDRASLRKLNRGLRAPVWRGQKYIPEGYALRLPVGADQPAPATVIAGIGGDQRYAAQVPDVQHRVRRGESLSGIAARYDTSLQDLMAMNNLRSPHRIRAGQRLRLPVDGKGAIEGDTYKVNPGDTLAEIARRAGIPTGALAEANNLDTDSPLEPGQKLRIAAAQPSVETAASGDVVPEPGAGTDAVADREIHTPLPPAQPHWSSTDPVDALARQISALTSPAAGAPTSTPSSDPALLHADRAPAAPDPATTGDLTADPSDYSVAPDHTIRVQPAETLGHYAEWLELRASDLRRLNNLRYGQPLVIGERLKLEFARVEPASFESRRRNHHREVQSAFFQRHHIRGTRSHRIDPGDSLWTLTRPDTDIPVWLLRQYNPDRDFADLQPGDRIRMPIVEQQQTSPVVAEGERDA